jgi:hypothetical protein
MSSLPVQASQIFDEERIVQVTKVALVAFLFVQLPSEKASRFSFRATRTHTICLACGVL